ncbi:unnamed protein product, partial [marine sediment metagenome]
LTSDSGTHPAGVDPSSRGWLHLSRSVSNEEHSISHRCFDRANRNYSPDLLDHLSGEAPPHKPAKKGSCIRSQGGSEADAQASLLSWDCPGEESGSNITSKEDLYAVRSKVVFCNHHLTCHEELSWMW